MNNIYQTNFIKNSSIYLKQKRLRHLNVLIVKNLKIKSNRFYVWFTLHHRVTMEQQQLGQEENTNYKAFFISDKKENERNPKWSNLAINLSKFTNKDFILR
jgi:hypothetical protein